MKRILQHKTLRHIAASVLVPVVLFAVLNVAFPLPGDRLHPASSTVVLDRDGAMLRAFLAPDEMWRIQAEADEISPTLKQAVLTYEDQRFYRHPGVDPFAIGRAMVANIRAGEVVQGGSTITMQVARMMEPKERTLVNKAIEAFRALQLEWRYSKEEILTLYFNLAPYGGNMVGVGAASQFYFDKSPDRLTLGEAALLAAIPNNPNANRPDVPSSQAQVARNKVLDILVQRGAVTADAATEAKTEAIPSRRFDLPFLAPHLAVHLASAHGGAARIETTLDRRLQLKAERLLADHVAAWRTHGITNGAVVVLDNRTMEVLALVGSQAFFDEAHNGQVNGALAARSPGSALKPFVYALALDQGLVSPRTLLHDIPVDYGGYQPENYDRTYSGIVSAEDALIRSLNVPAVGLSAELGADEMYHFLREAGFTTLEKPANHFGLSLILGGGEARLVELTTLYAALANGGNYQPYRWQPSTVLPPAQALLTPGAAHIVTDILSQLRRPELPAVWEWSRDQPTVAWKTGTSYGHRDAWSIGYTPRYSVGVWIGNMDASGSQALVGAEVAAPLMFSLMKVLEDNPSARWFLPPHDVERRRVCSVSGHPATHFCPSSRDEWYLPGRSPAQPCDLHRVILVDDSTGHRLCSHCKHGRPHHEEVVAQWPPDIATWLTQMGYPLDLIPEHLPSCDRVPAGDPPVIRAPIAEAEFRLRKGVPAQYQQIRLDASVSNGSKQIYWFVDGNLIFSGDPTERVFFTPEPGRHTLLCMDDEGRSAEVEITVL